MTDKERTIIIGIAIAIVLSWIATPVATLWVGKHLGLSAASAGQVGDMFGALNALFSGLAFLGLISALILQNKEIRSGQDEIKEQHNLQKRQVDLMRLSAQLAALPALLEAELVHLENHHKNEMGQLSVRTVHYEAVEKAHAAAIEELKKREAAGKQDWHYRCYVRNLENLKVYKRDLKSIYAQLNEYKG